LQVYIAILESKTVSCVIDGPFKDDKAGQVELQHARPGQQHDVEAAVTAAVPSHSVGTATRVTTVSGSQLAGVVPDPTTGEAVITSAASPNKELIPSVHHLNQELTQPSQSSNQPQWLTHVVAVAANIPFVNRWISTVDLTRTASGMGGIHQTLQATAQENMIHRSQSGWKVFGGGGDDQTIVDSEGDEGFDESEAAVEVNGARDFFKLVRDLEEMQETIAQLSAERDHARAKATRYEYLVSQLRQDLQSTEKTTNQKQDRITDLEGLLDLQGVATTVKADALKQAQGKITELEDQMLKLTSDIQVLLAERELFSLHGQNAQDTVHNMSKLYEEEVHSHRQALTKLSEVQREKENCLDRILELEASLNETQQDLESHIMQHGNIDKLKATLAEKESELADCRRYQEDLRCLLNQLQSQRAEEILNERKEQKKLANAYSQSLTDLEYFRALCGDLKTQVSTLKAQKKVLVTELRSLRDRGVYEVPVKSPMVPEEVAPDQVGRTPLLLLSSIALF
jgi:hypothetical protein